MNKRKGAAVPRGVWEGGQDGASSPAATVKLSLEQTQNRPLASHPQAVSPTKEDASAFFWVKQPMRSLQGFPLSP